MCIRDRGREVMTCLLRVGQNGVLVEAVRDAMGVGLLSICSCDVISVTAGNYGGTLGLSLIHI